MHRCSRSCALHKNLIGLFNSINENLHIVFSSIGFITSWITLTKREAAILNFSAPGIIATREVIMRGMTQSSTNQSAHISIITGTLIPSIKGWFSTLFGGIWIENFSACPWLTQPDVTKQLKRFFKNRNCRSC